MTRGQQPTPTRRTVLSVLGTGIAATSFGVTATARERAESTYALVQGDECVPVRPLRGREPVEAFYDYRLPESFVSDGHASSTGDWPLFASAGTTHLQRARTSVAFLYRGPERLSLVVVHGSVEHSDGGSVTFRISGLPEDGEWLVTDDSYREPDSGESASSNYDRWDVDSTKHHVDWTWGSGGTDGGAFGGLGDEFEVVVDPAFNDAATLYGRHYEGRVTDWEFLSGSIDAPERLSLDKNEPVRITTNGCEERRQDDGGTYTVCHEPPGNPSNDHTIEVGSESALESHLDHGDTKGPCSDE